MFRLPSVLTDMGANASRVGHRGDARSVPDLLRRVHTHVRSGVTVVAAMLLALVLTPHHAAAQSCFSATSSVPECVQEDLHTTATSGTLTFTIENDDVLDHIYSYWTNCSGDVINCSASDTYYVPAGTSTIVEMTYTLTGDGVADVIVNGDDGSQIEVSQAVYQQAALEIDSAQTVIYTGSQSAAPCAAGCFTAAASISTVPFYTLGEARSVTLAYNEERAHPRPFIYATVSPAQDGPAVSKYYFSAKLDTADVTFTTGEKTLTFLSPGNVPVRLGGQDILSGGLAVHNLTVSVTAVYASGTSATVSYSTKLVTYDASGSAVARGWTIANITQLACDWQASWQGCVVFGGDGSLTYYPDASWVATDHSTLQYRSDLQRYQRRFVDGSFDLYDNNGYMTDAVDPFGRTTSFVYDGNGRLTQIKDPRRNAGAAVPYIQLIYGAAGLSEIRETNGSGMTRSTLVSVDANGNLTRVTDPDGYATNIYYDSGNRISAIVDRRNAETDYTYDWSGKLKSIISPPAPIDAGAGTTSMQEAVTQLTAWQIAGVPNAPTASSSPTAIQLPFINGVVVAPGNRHTQFTVNDWGEPIETIDPLGRTTTITYDAYRPTLITYQDGSLTGLSYDSYDRVTSQSTTGYGTSHVAYNANSQPDSVWGGPTVTTRFHYNSDNTVASEASATGDSVAYAYNAAKMVTSTTDRLGHQTQYGYDAGYQIVDTAVAPGNRKTFYSVDVHGRQWQIQAPGSALRTITFDSLNRAIRIVDGSRPATVIGYDPLYRTDVTDANGNNVHFAYDSLGRLRSQRDASGATQYYRYDIAGRLTGWTNRRGQAMVYAYDPQDRLTSRAGSNIADSYSYSLDGNIAVASNATEIDSTFHSPPSGAGLYTVDSTVIHVNGVRYRVLHKTAGALNMSDSTRIIASSGVSFRNRYTSIGSSGLTSVVQDGFNSTSFGYDSEGRPITEANSIGTTRYPNWTSLHSLYSQGFNATSLSNSFARKYHYDGVGRIDTEGADFAGTQQVFHYDAYGQLTGVDNQTGCSAPVGNYTETDGWPLSCTSTPSSTAYTYDNVGNRTDLGATYYVGNRLALFNGGWNTYDADGNLHQKYLIPPNPHNEIFSWNPENRLDTVSTDGYYTVVYKYNALGQPVLKYRQGVLDRVWVWDGDQLLLETDGDNRRVGEYEYAGTDAPYAVVTGGTSPAAIQYQEQDALGNVLGTHVGTTVTQTISYDAWGYPSYSGDLTNRLMWKGLVWEGDMVGLYYMRGRWYDPAVGRFIQEDPLGVDGGINVYAFAADDPANGSDPSGECALYPDGQRGANVRKFTEWQEPTFHTVYWCMDDSPLGAWTTIAPMNVNASSDPEADPINVGLALALAQARQIPGTWTIEPTPFVAINYDKSLPKCIAKAGLLEVSGITDLSFMSEAYKGAEAAGFALDALGPALGRAWARSEFGVNTRSSRPLTQIAHASRGGILAIGTALSTQSGIGDVLQSLIPFRGTKNAYDSMMPSCGYGRTGDE